MTATAVREHVFYSSFLDLRLVRVTGDEESAGNGTMRRLRREVTVEFEDGRCRLRDGADVRVDVDGVERDIVRWMRAHRYFGIKFFEEGNEPDMLRPTEEEFVDALVAAVAALDADALRGLIDGERESHNRGHLIGRVERALEQVGAITEGPVSGDQTDPNLAGGGA